MRYIDLKKKVQKLFEESGVQELADIDWIAVHFLNVSRSFLPFVENISSEDEAKIMDAVQKRIKHIPLGYIFNETEFFGRKFYVDKNVLIPRLDTEVLIEKIINDIKNLDFQPSVLDIGTGSGAIAITIKKETGTKVTAVDISPEALLVAKQNAKQNDADIVFVQSNLFEKLSGRKFDIIVSNPPYIESSVIASLSPEVAENEPILALDGGVDGLDFYRKIIMSAKEHLNKNGRIYFEIGYNQAKAVSKLLEANFEDIEVLKDYEGNDRVVLAKLREL